MVIGEAALAADLITQLFFKHLERNLAVWKAWASKLKFLNDGKKLVKLQSVCPSAGKLFPNRF